MKKQSFLKGSIILIISVALTKLIGAAFKIPLTNMLGGTGMGYFSSAYGLFLPVYAVSVTGLPTAVAKLTSENLAFNRLGNVKKLRSTALLLFSAVGIVASLIIFIGAEPFCRVIAKTPESVIAVRMIAPSVFLGCITAVYRGYFEGIHNMTPTAASQVIEALIKAAGGLGLTYLVLDTAKNNPETFLKAASFFVDTEGATAAELSVPFAAAAAVLGVTLGSLGGMIFLILCSAFEKKRACKNSDGYKDSGKALMRKLLLVAVPVAAGSLITNLTSLTDLVTIVRCLGIAVEKSPSQFLGLGVPLSELPAFLYGSFNGLALTVFNLVPAFTNMLGKGALPGIAEAYALKDFSRLKKSVSSVLFMSAVFSIPAGLGLTVLARPVLELLFSSRHAEVLASWRSLSLMGTGIIALSLSAAAFAVLQAAGKLKAPVKIMLAGVAVKLLGNIVLISIPRINIDGAAISTTACYIVILILSLIALKKETGVSINFSMIIIKPLYSGILCAAAAGLSHSALNARAGAFMTLLLSVLIGAAVYFLALYLLETPVKEEIRSIF